MDVARSFPSLAWVGERAVGSACMVLVCWLVSCCWRSARVNQRLSLADWDDNCREERRGLLTTARRFV